MDPAVETNRRRLRQHQCALSRLDWYDTTFAQSFETCEAALPGFLVAVFGVLPLMWMLTGLLTQESLQNIVVVLFIGAPFVLFISMFCFVLAKLAVSIVNAASGYAMKAQTQIAVTGGLASFFCLSPLSNSATYVSVAIFAAGATVGHVFAGWLAKRPATWRKWANGKTIPKAIRRPQLQLKNTFYLTACCAAVFSVAGINRRLGIAIATFFTVEAGLLLMNAAWVRMRSPVQRSTKLPTLETTK